MRKLIFVLLVSVMFAGGYVTASPVDAGLIGGDADWMVRVDIEQFLKSEIGKIIRTEISERPVEMKLNNFANVFGFHPIDGLRNITLYGQGRDPDKAVVLVEGNFNKDRLIELISRSSEYKKFEYNGIEVHQWLQRKSIVQDDSEQQLKYGCFYRDDLIVIGSGLTEFMQAVDVLSGEESGSDEEVFNDTLLQNQDAFIQIATTNLAQSIGDHAKAAILKQAEQLVAIIGEKDESAFATIKLTAGSSEVAQNINQILEGVIAFVELSSDERPVLSNLAQNIQLTCSGNTVQIHIESAPGLIQQLILNNIEIKELLK